MKRNFRGPSSVEVTSYNRKGGGSNPWRDAVGLGVSPKETLKTARFCFAEVHACSDECPRYNKTPFGEETCSVLEELLDRVRDDVDFVHCPRAVLLKNGTFIWGYVGTCYVHAPPKTREEWEDATRGGEDWFQW